MRQDLVDREGNPWDFLVSDHFLILNYGFISLEIIWQGSYPFSYPQDVLGMLLADLDNTHGVGDDVGKGIGDSVGDGVKDNVGDDVGDVVGDGVSDSIRLRRIAPLGFHRIELVESYLLILEH